MVLVGPESSKGDSSMEAKKKKKTNGHSFTCGGHIRHLIVVLATLCLTSAWANVLTFNFAVICMGDGGGESGGNESGKNASDSGNKSSSQSSSLSYSSDEKTLLICAVAVGALATCIPVTFLLNRFGVRIVYTAIGALSAIATGLIPVAAVQGLPYFTALRFVQGVALVAAMPVVGSVVAHWATLKERAIFLSLLTGFQQLAPVFSMPLSGVLCSTIGWPSVYYSHAALSALLFALFAVCYRNNPHEGHPCLGDDEHRQLQKGKENADEEKAEKPCASLYLRMLRTVSVWAVIVAAIGNYFGGNLLMLFTPTYLKNVLGFRVLGAGISSALPGGVQFVVKMISGAVSDRSRCCSEAVKVRVFNTAALAGMAVCFVALAFLTANEATLALIVLIASGSVLGFTPGGFYKSVALISGERSRQTMTMVQLMMCATMLAVPVVVDGLTPDDTVEQWRVVFLIHAGVLLATNVIFCLFAGTEPAEWAEEAGKKRETKKNDTNEKGNLQQNSKA